MNRQSLKELLDKYLEGNCTLAEKALIERFYMQESKKRDIPIDAADPIQKKAESWDVIREQISEFPQNPNGKSNYRLFKSIGYAAALLIVLFAGLYFYPAPQKGVPVSKVARSKIDIKPGSNKAILTLADGTSLVLDEAKDGIIASQPGLIVKKTKEGQLIYTLDPVSKSTSSLSYNTITTPRGGAYQINLPDGTKVWLNAASSLQFPVHFTLKERSVELTGEAYFEVAKNKNKPFLVKTGRQSIEVLGTHFNVNAYPDEESYHTTLLEGSVRILTENDNHLLKPGEQAIMSAVSGKVSISDADTEEAVAWKNNKISFSSQPIEKIMRQVSRWYNVDIVYKGNISGKTFTGTISRYANVSEVLNMLELTDLVHFKIEERRITVMP